MPEGLNEYEQRVFESAKYFTAVRGFNGGRTTHEFDTYEEACEYADAFAIKGRTMIYAVDVLNRTAHIGNR